MKTEKIFIYAKIEGIKYEIHLKSELKQYNFQYFNINDCSSSCKLKLNDITFAISKWVSSKRTRSYPYERVYNTLSNNKKITVIPFIKDEGKQGDRDFLQWDTISMMSL